MLRAHWGGPIDRARGGVGRPLKNVPMGLWPAGASSTFFEHQAVCSGVPRGHWRAVWPIPPGGHLVLDRWANCQSSSGTISIRARTGPTGHSAERSGGSVRVRPMQAVDRDLRERSSLVHGRGTWADRSGRAAAGSLAFHSTRSSVWKDDRG